MSQSAAIRPLPAQVAAQISSATAIVSLAQVVLELLKNALDATPSRIEAAVDVARGDCTVEDDGVGIPPHEFHEQGGLGKCHCTASPACLRSPTADRPGTSKYHAAEALFGRNGTFLASLAAVSLLTITSHHHQHRSHNSLTFHRAKIIARQCPAPAHSQVHGKHGTRVTVRNLFGNIPVRVKQRAAVIEQTSEQDRIWDALKRDVVGLLLSWQGAVSLRIRDGSGKTVINLNATIPTDTINSDGDADVKPRSARLTAMLKVLTQAGYISVDTWPSWVPVAASTSLVSIQGAISLDPAPTKHTQFLSLGNQPLLPASGNNELFDQINRLFSLSSFGTIEEMTNFDSPEKMRRQSYKRRQSNGYISRRLRTRKDIDKYPMFHLRIILNEDQSSSRCADQLGNESTMQTTLEILEAMVTQWLSAHHFCPQLRRGKRDRPSTASSDFSSSTTHSTALVAEPLFGLLQPRTKRSQKSNSIPKSGKRIRLQSFRSSRPSEKSQSCVFAEWSRIKSGKTDFFDKAPALTDPKTMPNATESLDNLNLQPLGPPAVNNSTQFNSEPVPQGAFNLEIPDQIHRNKAHRVELNQRGNDDTILWTDPLTKNIYLLNARTGCVVPNVPPRPNAASTSTGPFLSQKTMKKPLRLPQRPATASEAQKPWLANMLHNWDNPVFKLNERRIQHVELHKPDLDHSHYRHHCSRIDIDKAFNQVAGDASSGKLSKYGLRHAEVIAQVDKKFVLAKMKRQSSSPPSVNDPGELLVLIDQHAADERIQVEHLFRQLCSPITSEIGLIRYTSSLGHQAQVVSILLDKPLQFSISQIERTHFTTHAARFAAWGILFDISDAKLTGNHSSSSIAKSQALLSATSLPPAVLERCKADPKVLISLLRSTVWKYVEDLHLLPLSSHRVTSSPLTPAPKLEEDSEWVRRLATCPPGLIDLINSRACRSAIMFNDELNVEQCKQLVHRLADCVFPFMCAHGRPSMVPLVSLGHLGDGSQRGFADAGFGEGGDAGFTEAWTQWQRGRILSDKTNTRQDGPDQGWSRSIIDLVF